MKKAKFADLLSDDVWDQIRSFAKVAPVPRKPEPRRHGTSRMTLGEQAEVLFKQQQVNRLTCQSVYRQYKWRD